MTSSEERLAVRQARARVRYVEDVTLALKEAEPSKADVEEALGEQIGHGKRLVEMAEAACYLASVARLGPEGRDQMEWALTQGVRAFRDLQAMVADWRRREGMSLEGEEGLGALVAEMARCRAELASGSQERPGDAGAELAALPRVGTAEWGRMNQRRAELIRKQVRGELSEGERDEYETLQRSSLAAVEAAFPRQGNAKLPEGPWEASGG